MKTVMTDIQKVASAMLTPHFHMPFGINATESVMRVLGVDWKTRYASMPKPKLAPGKVPLGQDVHRKLTAIQEALGSLSCGYREPTQQRPSPALLTACGFPRNREIPRLSGPNAEDWAGVFRCVRHSEEGLEAALRLATAAGVGSDPYGVKDSPTDVPHTKITDSGERRWTF